MPENLIELYCFTNKLTNLPDLPNTLIKLYCYGNQLTILPTLPNTLIELNCSVNKLTNLPNLPENLNHLDCYSNQLTILPVLPNNLQILHFDNTVKITQYQFDFIKNINCEILNADSEEEELTDLTIISIAEYNQILENNNNQEEEYKNNFNNTNNILNCNNTTTFTGDEINEVNKILLFFNEQSNKYIIYCYTAQELIDSLLIPDKLYKWNIDMYNGTPNLNKRVLKEPYTNCYINYDNLNKLLIYNCLLLKPTKKYKLGTGQANWVSRMHGTDNDIYMVYDLYPVNYTLIHNKVKISNNDIINFIPRLEDINNKYNTDLIITDTDTNTVIEDINNLNVNTNYKIIGNKIEIVSNDKYRRDIIKDNKYSNIIKLTEFYK